MVVRATFLFFVFVVAALGCRDGADKSFDSVAITVYSLDPHSKYQKDQSQGEWYQGFRVLGKIAVTDSSTKRQIKNAIEQGYKEKPSRGADCFDPRHGVSIIENGDHIEYVICFACSNIRKVVNSKSNEMSLFGNAPSPVLRKVLKDANIPIAD